MLLHTRPVMDGERKQAKRPACPSPHLHGCSCTSWRWGGERTAVAAASPSPHGGGWSHWKSTAPFCRLASWRLEHSANWMLIVAVIAAHDVASFNVWCGLLPATCQLSEILLYSRSARCFTIILSYVVIAVGTDFYCLTDISDVCCVRKLQCMLRHIRDCTFCFMQV